MSLSSQIAASSSGTRTNKHVAQAFSQCSFIHLQFCLHGVQAAARRIDPAGGASERASSSSSIHPTFPPAPGPFNRRSTSREGGGRG